MRLRLSESQVGQLTDFLAGTAFSLDQGCQQIGLSANDLDEPTLQTLDTLIFQCRVCGLWLPAEKLYGYDVCQLCGIHEDEQHYHEFIEMSDEILDLGGTNVSQS